MNTEPIEKHIKFIGLQMPYGDNFCSYFESLPDYFILCEDFRDLYRLKKGKKTFKKENYEINMEMSILIYSITSKVYYHRELHEYSNMNELFKYFKDKNLYIFQEDKRKKIELNIEEKKEVPEISDPEDCIF